MGGGEGGGGGSRHLLTDAYLIMSLSSSMIINDDDASNNEIHQITLFKLDNHFLLLQTRVSSKGLCNVTIVMKVLLDL